MSSEKFFIEDPSVLFTNIRIFPLEDMTRDEKLNALTRLSIVIAVILYFLQYEYWLTFLILALLIIVLLKYATKVERAEFATKEDFTLVPTYIPEEQQIYPLEEYSGSLPIYPHRENYSGSTPNYEYPHREFFSRTTLLPRDEFETHALGGGSNQARRYVNRSFVRNELAYRDNLMRTYERQMARRFRNTTRY